MTVRRPAGPLEITAALATVGLTLATFWHGLTVYFCWSDCQGPDDSEILAHRLLTAGLALAVVTTLVTATLRRGRWVFLWHLTMAGIALVVALLTAMPQIDWDGGQSPPPAPGPDYVPCYSGSNECVGG
jgi:O-antigen ligase